MGMTHPTITYSHAVLYDDGDPTGWAKVETGTCPSTLTSEFGDIFKIESAPGTAGDDYVTYTKSGLSISTTLYRKLLVRWKTSDVGSGMEAKLKLTYTTVGAKTTTLGFSTAWKTTTIALEEADTLTAIAMIADDNPNTLAAGTFQVRFDFILVADIFIFPFVHDINVDFPECDVHLPIPGRRNPVTQYVGGREPVTITLSGKIDVGPSSSWGNPLLRYLIDIWQSSHSDAWQWLTIGGATDSDRLINCKVRPGRLRIGQIKSDEATRTWSLPLKLYSLSNLDETTWANLEAFGI